MLLLIMLSSSLVCISLRMPFDLSWDHSFYA
jgi:hypothetical protein